MIKKIKNNRGFTMVEMIVGMSLFTIIVSIATGSFINSMRTQRISVSLIAAQSNASLMMEQITREIRTGKNFSLVNGELGFKNAKGENVVYRAREGAVEKIVDDNPGVITAENINVERLEFILIGNNPGDGRPPQITINIGFGSKEFSGGKAVINLQATISSRILDGV
ncbi:type II secretion system protein [Candidatus Wolfebacteria bacterium]|nr:type II secretion system protein [Candidatus Wolfebacteria bacterium]